MNALISGINSYLGNASLLHLPQENFQVFGIVRDVNFILKKINKPIQAQLFNFDLINFSDSSSVVNVPNCHIGIYFSHPTELNDLIVTNYQIMLLRNFIKIMRKNNCNRILYVGRLYDSKYLGLIEKLFKELQVDFTIILKDIALHAGSIIDDFTHEIRRKKIICLYKPLQKILVRPILLEDLMRFIRSTDWSNTFINQYVEFGGDTQMDIAEIIQSIPKSPFDKSKNIIIPIASRFFSKLCNSMLSRFDKDPLKNLIHQIEESKLMNQPSWNKIYNYSHPRLGEF